MYTCILLVRMYVLKYRYVLVYMYRVCVSVHVCSCMCVMYTCAHVLLDMCRCILIGVHVFTCISHVNMYWTFEHSLNMYLVSEHELTICACFWDVHMCFTCWHVFGMWACV